jgi:hypothetical protein
MDMWILIGKVIQSPEVLRRLPIGITSGTGSHEPRTWGTAPSHAQSLRHYPGILPALKAQ